MLVTKDPVISNPRPCAPYLCKPRAALGHFFRETALSHTNAAAHLLQAKVHASCDPLTQLSMFPVFCRARHKSRQVTPAE